MIMNPFDELDLDRPPALVSDPTGHTEISPRGFRGADDERLVDAQTDSEIARAYLYHAELAPTTLKSTKTELGRFLLWFEAPNKTQREQIVEKHTPYN